MLILFFEFFLFLVCLDPSHPHPQAVSLVSQFSEKKIHQRFYVSVGLLLYDLEQVI